MNQSKRTTVIQVIIFLSISAGLIVWQFEAMDKAQRGEMLKALQQVKYIYILPAGVAAFLSHYFRSLRWKLLLRPLDIHPTTANTLFAVLTGYLFNALIPRLGEVAKCGVLAKYEKAPVDKMIGSIVAERVFDMLCLMIIFLIVLLTQYHIVSPYAIELYHKAFFNAGGDFVWMRIVLATAALIVCIAAGYFVYRKIRHTKAGHFINRMLDGLKTILHISEKGLFLLYTLLIWLMYTTVAVLGFYMLPGLDHLSWLAGLSIVAFGSIAVIVTPGGLGAFPIVTSAVLFLYGIDKAIGTAYGWVNWSMQTCIVILLGLFSLILLPIYNRKRHAKQIRPYTE